MEVVSWAVGLLVRLGSVSPWNSFGGVDRRWFRCWSVSCCCCRSVVCVVVDNCFDSRYTSSTHSFNRVAGRSASSGAYGLPFLLLLVGSSAANAGVGCKISAGAHDVSKAFAMNARRSE